MCSDYKSRSKVRKGGTELTNTAELEAAIARTQKSKKEIAAALSLSETGLWKKIRNKSEFKAREIKILQNILDLSDQKRDFIFFA